MTAHSVFAPELVGSSLHQDLFDVATEFGGRPGFSSEAARVAIQMQEFGFDIRTDAGQIKAAEVLRKRMSKLPRADGLIERLEQRAATEQCNGAEFVYYIDLYGAQIKIGYTRNLERRLQSLRRDLDHVLALEPGGRQREAHRHAQFRADRVGAREDFHRSDALLVHIEQIRAEHGSPFEVMVRSTAG